MSYRARFAPSPNYIAGSGTVEGDFTINGALVVLGSSSFSGSGEANTMANVGTGAGVYKQKSAVQFELRSLTEAGSVKITQNTNDITISGSGLTTGSSLGTGEHVYGYHEGSALRFRSLVAGSNVTIQSGSTFIAISASAGGSGETNTASNLGAGQGIFAQKNGVDLEFRTLVAGPNITLTSGSDTIGITGSTPGETNTMSNVGSGQGIFQAKSNVDFRLRSLTQGTDIALVSGTNDITINSQITASSLGSDQHIFAYKTGSDLKFRSLNAISNIGLNSGSNNITIAPKYYKVFKNAELPSGNIAAFPDIINSNNTYKFASGATDRTLYFRDRLYPYNSGSIKSTIVYFTETATTGTIRWQTAFERQTSGSVVLVNTFDTAGQQTIPHFPTASGTIYYATGTHSTSQIANIVEGEMFRFRVKRQSSDTGDTVTGNAHLLFVYLEEQ